MKYLTLALIFNLLLVCFSANVSSQDSPPKDEDGDQSQNESEKVPTPGDPFNPYTGNEYRYVKDLEIWGAVGEIPFVWMRYSNSRTADYNRTLGTAHNWRHSFQFDMTRTGLNDQGQQQMKIKYPEGPENVFTQNQLDSSLWEPAPGVDKRLFQEEDTFILQTKEGYRYRFQKFTNQIGAPYFLLMDFVDSKQNNYALSYSNTKLLTKVTEPAGRFFKLSYVIIEGTPFVKSVTTNDNRSVHYDYTLINSGGKQFAALTTVSYGDGTKAKYTYSTSYGEGRPNLKHAIDPRYLGTQPNMKFSYEIMDTFNLGFIKEEINGVTDEVMVTLDTKTEEDLSNKLVCAPNGRKQVYYIPESHAGLTRIYTDGLGRSTHYYYGEDVGFLQSLTDPAGRVTDYINTIYGNALQTIYPDNSKATFTRNDLDLPLTYTDQLGRTTTYTRDNLHRVTSIAHPDGTMESFTYNEYGQISTHARKNGGIEYFKHDANGLLTEFTDALGNTTSYSYDSADRLACITDANEHQTCYEYNERGLIVKIIYADGSERNYAYDDFGNRTSLTDEAGHVWTTNYDEFKRPVTITDPLNHTTIYNYDLQNGVPGSTHSYDQPTRITLPSGKITEIEYDVEWQKIKECIGVGTAEEACTFYEYDMVGNLTSMIDPKGSTWTYEYDELDRKIGETDPLGNKTQWVYDKVGNVISVIRPDSSATINQYDKMNRIIKTTDPKSQITKFKYDAEGNTIKLTDPNNNSYTFLYDLLNRQTDMIYPCGTSESYTYDEVGNLATYKNRAGKVQTYTYDSRNRETLCDWNDNTPDISKTYSADNLLLTLASNVSTLTFEYNAAHELISETQTIAGATPRLISYGRNEDGLRSAMNYPEGKTIEYSYTGRNQVAAIFSNGLPLVEYSYDYNGNRIGKVLENGTSTNYFFDDANRMMSLNNLNNASSFARFDYGYDNVSRRTFVKRDNDKGDVFSYDATDQVKDVLYEVTDPETNPTNPIRTVNYFFDPVGNRTTVTDNGTPTSYASDKCNQYTAVGNISPTYNQNGALRTFDGWTYTYDAQDRLTKAKNSNTNAQFFYDPLNRCVKRIINGSTMLLYYDGWSMIEERSDEGTLLTQYVHGAILDEVLTKASGGTTVYYHHDDIPGNVVRLTDNTGSVIEQYYYDIFGTPTIKNALGIVISSSALGNRFMFTGREFIKEVGLYDYRNRMYSPTLGRFLQVEPIRFLIEDFNLYRYVHNNPINLIDPIGLMSWKKVGAYGLGAIGIVLGIAAAIVTAPAWVAGLGIAAGVAGAAALALDISDTIDEDTKVKFEPLDIIEPEPLPDDEDLFPDWDHTPLPKPKLKF